MFPVAATRAKGGLFTCTATVGYEAKMAKRPELHGGRTAVRQYGSTRSWAICRVSQSVRRVGASGQRRHFERGGPGPRLTPRCVVGRPPRSPAWWQCGPVCGALAVPRTARPRIPFPAGAAPLRHAAFAGRAVGSIALRLYTQLPGRDRLRGRRCVVDGIQADTESTAYTGALEAEGEGGAGRCTRGCGARP